MENKALVRALADRINDLVDIPLINEANEQIFFELIVSILVEIFLNTLDLELNG
ncbi:MAG: hypothetical protein RBQ67_05895 [Candidatus Cloacimonadaceae bacterium]|jgi:hypothetical protein|nr:hypothetical protein [Candidatus Cloacimonadota bacterium]MDD3524339.1 hypothetical protein [Candidatus Cloacimonadota bacterium]MDY0319506.1 hypothetical protein [Candidatus Cloacimonadaceae bacterium]